jgi:hypothetical protein
MTTLQIDTNGLRWFDDSPSAGPDCMCSHCDQPIAEEVPIRLWNTARQEARLHWRCFLARAPQEATDGRRSD